MPRYGTTGGGFLSRNRSDGTRWCDHWDQYTLIDVYRVHELDLWNSAKIEAFLNTTYVIQETPSSSSKSASFRHCFTKSSWSILVTSIPIPTPSVMPNADQIKEIDPRGRGRPFGANGSEKCNSAGTSCDVDYALSRIGMILIKFLNVCEALPKRFVPKSFFLWQLSEIFEHFWKITVWHMAVPRVYVRRGTTVWSVTN